MKHIKYSLCLAIAVLIFSEPSTPVSAQSTDTAILRRLEALEKNNAMLRDRLRQLESKEKNNSPLQLIPSTSVGPTQSNPNSPTQSSAVIPGNAQTNYRDTPNLFTEPPKINPAEKERIESYFDGESRERVISAAIAVLNQSDPNKFEIQRKFDGFIATRSVPIFIATIEAGKSEEKWEIRVDEPAPQKIRASGSISILRTAIKGNQIETSEGQHPDGVLFNLFWNRVDYVLHLRDDWISCERAVTNLMTKGIDPSTIAGLCGPNSLGKNSPAPEKLPFERSWAGR